MKLIKLVGFLLLLLWGSAGSGISATPSDEGAQIDSSLFSSEITEDFHEVSASWLFTNSYVQSGRPFIYTAQDYYLSSSYQAWLAENYIDSTQTIRPGLDVPDIIFPFHYFF